MLPWSAFWETNYFAIVWPVLRPLFTNHFIRGAVTGLGLVNLSAGVSELLGMFVARDRTDGPPSRPDAESGSSYADRPDPQVEP